MNEVHKCLFFITSNEVIWHPKNLTFTDSLMKYSFHEIIVVVVVAE